MSFIRKFSHLFLKTKVINYGCNIYLIKLYDKTMLIDQWLNWLRMALKHQRRASLMWMPINSMF